MSIINHLFFEARGLGVKMSSARGLETTVLENPRDIINSLFHTRKTWLEACAGWGAGPSKNRSREKSKGEKQLFPTGD